MAESNVNATLPKENVSDVTYGLPQTPLVFTNTWLPPSAMVSLPKIPPDGLFTGFNLQWRQYVHITPKGRLMRHLEGDRPSHSDPAYYNWLDVEGVVHRWLLDSIASFVKGEFLSLESARAVWEAVLDNHSKKNNIATLYELVHRAANLRQGDRSVMDYNNELTALWAEIDHYMPPDPESVDRKYILQLRVFQFLMGLNPEYEQLRGQLIHRETLNFKDALRSVRLEEARLQQAQSGIPATAMAIQSSTTTQATTRAPSLTGNLSRGTPPRIEDTPRGDPTLFCNYCKKRGHSKETCFKLQRKRAQQAHVATHVATVSPPGSTSGVSLPNQVPMAYRLLPQPRTNQVQPGTAVPSFTPEEMERLRRLLDPPVVGSCSLAHAGTSTALATSSEDLSCTSPSTSSLCLVDSGASSHMTPNPRGPFCPMILLQEHLKFALHLMISSLLLVLVLSLLLLLYTSLEFSMFLDFPLRKGKDRPRFGRPNRTETISLSKWALTVSVKIQFRPPRAFNIGPNRKKVNFSIRSSTRIRHSGNQGPPNRHSAFGNRH